MIRTIICALAFAAAPALALAADAPATTLFPGALDIPIFEGASVPDDCHFPASLQDPARFELACVVMPMDERSEEVSMNFIGWLGQHSFRRDMDIVGGMSAVRPADNGCEQVLDIFTREYPPETEESIIIWFALERQPRCSAPSG